MDNFDQYLEAAFTAPDCIPKLRELILSLAMQGNLVPQNHNDAPANKLLNDIKNEKMRLVKEGRIKAPKHLSKIDSAAIPYTIPVGWQWVRLGSIGNIFNGNSINSAQKEAKYAGAVGLPYIATKDVGYGFDSLEYENGICIPPTEQNLFKIAHNGSVLICSEGGSAGKKCGLTDRDVCFGNKLFAIELYGEISAKFILYTYLSPGFRESFNSSMTGIIGGVSIAKFVEIPIGLPPLAEQHRIVAKIDNLMAKCKLWENLQQASQKKRILIHSTALSQLLEATETSNANKAWSFIIRSFSDLYSIKKNVLDLRKAVLQLAIMGKLSEQKEDDRSVDELVAKINSESSRYRTTVLQKDQIDRNRISYTIPESWGLLPLGSILTFGPTNGYSPKAVDYETKVKSLTLTATTSGIFKGEYSKFIDETIPTDSELWLRDGDILVQRGNTIDYVGVSAIYRGEPNQYIYPDLMMKLRVSNEVDSDYVCFAMSASPSRDFLRNRATGTSGTMPKINQKTLASLPIPIPPLLEQRRIVEKINKLLQKFDQLENKIDTANLISTELLNAVTAQV